jgi:hypothetical protein
VALLVALGLLAGTGCGLGDYEQLMDKERKRVKKFDEEYQFLGPPLNMPADASEGDVRKQPALQRIDVFLRPPKGVSNRCADKDNLRDKPANTRGMPLYRYIWGEGKNVFLAGHINDGTNNLSAQQFQQEVRVGVGAFHQAAYQRPLPSPPEPKLVEVVKEPLPSRAAPPRIKFLALTLEDPGAPKNDEEIRVSYRIFFHQSGKYQVAVVYQVTGNAAEQQAVNQALDFSLKSLGIGTQNSAAQRKAYFERLAYFPSKKG